MYLLTWRKVALLKIRVIDLNRWIRLQVFFIFIIHLVQNLFSYFELAGSTPSSAGQKSLLHREHCKSLEVLRFAVATPLHPIEEIPCISNSISRQLFLFYWFLNYYCLFWSIYSFFRITSAVLISDRHLAGSFVHIWWWCLNLRCFYFLRLEFTEKIAQEICCLRNNLVSNKNFSLDISPQVILRFISNSTRIIRNSKSLSNVLLQSTHESYFKEVCLSFFKIF